MFSPWKGKWSSGGKFFAGAEPVWDYLAIWNKHCRANDQGTHMVIRRTGPAYAGDTRPFSGESNLREFQIETEHVEVTRLNGRYRAAITFGSGINPMADGYPHIDCSGFINGEIRAMLRVSDSDAFWIDDGSLRKYRHPCGAAREAWNYLLIVGHKREPRIVGETSLVRARAVFGHELALDPVRTCRGVNEATHKLDPITFTALD